MKAVINGITLEGTPEEFVQFFELKGRNSSVSGRFLGSSPITSNKPNIKLTLARSEASSMF
ncbi:hypothetical protein [Sporosarcina sp. USHLN248]|uniref:hypothetical protein n=1 Tax=Sporosarcina sp. USHLN248 TaxID=3081300 RepID=UPI00301AB02B